MKNLAFKTYGLFLTLFMTFFLIGCASEPVKVDIPTNHPANPEAQEAEFIPPPNPFQQDVVATNAESTTDAMMKHKPHDKKGQKHMHHNLGTKKASEPDQNSTKKSVHGEDDNHHKGHSQ